MKKTLKTILLFIIVVLLILSTYLFFGKSEPAEKIDWGVTFSKKAASGFGLDWQKTFLATLDDLKVKRLRIIAYWDEIEKEKGKYNFEELDWQVDEIGKRNGEIILVVGRRLPRWPECFEPEWVKTLPEDEKQDGILTFISETVNRYKENEAVKIWQVENEPFLRTFGECPKLDKDFFEKEIALVNRLDSRPIMITESGEFSTWIGGAKRADIVGTSIYRKIYGKLGYVQYPIPPVFYQRKANLIKSFFDISEIIAIEVQAEPWGDKPNQQMTNEEQDITMSLKRFEDMLEYTRQTGFDKAYLWGVEWWYWRKERGDDSFWNKAKELF